jgi:seryl-tRNA synthetase
MIDIKKIKQDINAYKEVIEKRNLNIDLDGFLVLEEEKNKISSFLDSLRNMKNITSKEIPYLS